ncbi:succinate dehydrogenase subunit D [Nitrospirillum amazonense]|uniref:Succinate dehydrogenase hydrophobic membrane anchor subunit n=1 Tax=Nitrospirillum amazonense TaxID=28077 RepID=A0A560FIE6_9PROT|nr:succinate dehydrogenase, hydrophobic membrane anchor protein [Nitrospirillum amazonense]TWB21391.1 succinate dehydrogenase subunit D [Nitrospirillum amazonense]
MASTSDNGFRTRLGRVRGLGSAKSGGAHWLAYRMVAVLLVPLTVWFLISIVRLAKAEQADAIAWLHQPVNAVLLLITLIATFHHAAAGMREVYEDYIHGKLARLIAIGLTNGAAILLAAASVFAVLKIAFGA